MTKIQRDSAFEIDIESMLKPMDYHTIIKLKTLIECNVTHAKIVMQTRKDSAT